MSDNEIEGSISEACDQYLEEDIMELETVQHNNNYKVQQTSQFECGEIEFNIGSSVSGKRAREDEDDDSYWTEVGRGGKKVKDSNNKIEVYVSCSEKLPKQFSLAKIFKDNGVHDAVKVKYINPYRLRVEFNNELSAERFIACENLKALNWRMSKSMEVGYSYGIIKNVDLDLNEDQILKDISCPTSAELINVKRLNRRDHIGNGWISSETVRLCFKGPFLPAYVVVDRLKIYVEKYVFPVTQCSRCWKLGHSAKRCVNKIVCPKCSGHHPNCESSQFCCPNCSGRHMALSKDCPVYIREKRIRSMMADFNCTYRKALLMCNSNFPSKSKAPTPYTLTQQVPSTSKIIDINKTLEEHSYANVVKGNSIQEQQNSSINSSKNSQNSKKTIKKFNFYNLPQPQIETANIQTTEVSEMQKPACEERREGNVTFIELLEKIKIIIFNKRDSISVKVQSVLKICCEWCLLWFKESLSQWPLLKCVLDLILGSDYV